MVLYGKMIIETATNREYLSKERPRRTSGTARRARATRTLAYPYGALVLGPPNFGGLGPEGPIPFTEFRASGADMYGTLLHQILPFLVHV
jgi:hypothetical protein